MKRWLVAVMIAATLLAGPVGDVLGITHTSVALAGDDAGDMKKPPKVHGNGH